MAKLDSGLAAVQCMFAEKGDWEFRANADAALKRELSPDAYAALLAFWTRDGVAEAVRRIHLGAALAPAVSAAPTASAAPTDSAAPSAPPLPTPVAPPASSEPFYLAIDPGSSADSHLGFARFYSTGGFVSRIARPAGSISRVSLTQAAPTRSTQSLPAAVTATAHLRRFGSTGAGGQREFRKGGGEDEAVHVVCRSLLTF